MRTLARSTGAALLALAAAMLLTVLAPVGVAVILVLGRGRLAQRRET